MENAYVSERTADSEDALLSEEGAGDLEDTMSVSYTHLVYSLLFRLYSSIRFSILFTSFPLSSKNSILSCNSPKDVYKRQGLSLVRHEHIYQAIKEEHKEHNYPKIGRAHV